MVIPKGYKQTEIGIIPEDWDVDSLGLHVRVETGSKNTEDKIDNGTYPFFVRSQKVERINSYTYDCEAILTAGDGVGTGKIFHYINGKFDAHQRVYVLSQFLDINPHYFYYVFSNMFYSEVCKYTAKSSVDSVRRDMITKMKIPIPKIEEQTAIANVLTHIDELIASLQKLIEKKRAVKQGTMQELLTGKKRLPGFKGKWETVQLKKISTLSSGGTPLTSINTYYTGNIPFMNISDISNSGKYLNNTEKYITEDAVANSSAYKFPPNMLLFAMYASIGKCAINTVEMTCSQAILCINPIKINLEYLYYNFVNREKEFLGMRQTGTQNNLNKIIMGNVIIPYPSYEEQSAIADILTNMDNEIEQLEQKLAKYEKIKIGMMQNLLTGKIRLPTT